MKNTDKNNKKKHSFLKRAQGLLTVILIAVIVILLKFGGGLGIGNGSGNGDNAIDAYKDVTDVSESDFNDGIVTTATQAPETSKTSVTSSKTEIVEVMVSGHDYLYMNKKIELDEFINELKNTQNDIEIRISADNTAAMNTMEDLTESLEKNGFANYYKVK